jgi:hypothetical protein
MSEIILHIANLPKSYFLKNRLFLGGIGVDNNYILYIIYNIIFYAIYTIRLFF